MKFRFNEKIVPFSFASGFSRGSHNSNTRFVSKARLICIKTLISQADSKSLRLSYTAQLERTKSAANRTRRNLGRRKNPTSSF